MRNIFHFPVISAFEVIATRDYDLKFRNFEIQCCSLGAIRDYVMEFDDDKVSATFDVYALLKSRLERSLHIFHLFA